MRQKAAFALLVLSLAGCHGDPRESLGADNRPLSFQAVLSPLQAGLRPGAPHSAMSFFAQVRRQPDNVPMDLRNWPQGAYQWEILNVPQGADGGSFMVPASGTVTDAWAFVQNDTAYGHSRIVNVYQAPSAFPPGTTRLELKLRFTFTFPASDRDYAGMKAVGEATIVLDANAPGVTVPDPPP